ncbi:MAG: hypothetical protein HY699_03005 [Deltaproteobacteria bacterium]|nr:hypothetical protein [Deltaproteobacteria bacterium]
MHTPRQLYTGIAFSAAAVLILEIGLTRIFSYTIWYHFAYLTISVALLGFGASGSFLTVFRGANTRRDFLTWAAVGGQVGVVLALAVVSAVPLDPLKVVADKSALGRLLLYYVVVTLPFFAGGLCVAGPLQARPELVSRLYFADLLAAGIACGLIVPSIWWIGTPITTGMATVAFGVAAWAYAAPQVRLRQGVIAAVLGLAGVLLCAQATFTPAPTKFVSRFLAAAGAQLGFSRWTPINRVDVVTFDPPPRTGSYVNWGISPNYKGQGPGYFMVGNDGDSCAVMYNWDGKPETIEFLRHHVLRVPYLLLSEPSVVAIGLGGGADVLNGLLNGARSIVGVEINPATVYAGKTLFREFNGNILNHPKVDAVASEGRSFLRTRNAHYDLIEINSVDTLSALSTGAYVLSESYLYTADAVSDYLSHLNPGGIFAMAVGDLNDEREPPRHTLRLASVVRRALEMRKVQEPARHVLVVGTGNNLPLTHTLVKNEPFTQAEVAAVEAFVNQEGFVFWHRPDQVLPTRTAEILTWDQPRLSQFYREYYLNLQPTTDESPFFFNFYKWSALLQRSGRADVSYDRTLATGQIVMVVMLIQSVVFGAGLILLPLLFVRTGGTGLLAQRAGYLAYFAALGIGFILLEISFIQRFVLFLGYPTYALTVVLLSLLVFTGLGSYLTDKIHDGFGRVLLWRLLWLLVVAGAFHLGLTSLFNLFLGVPLAGRVLLSIVLLAPLGLILGAFFPLGIRVLELRASPLIPWAWGVNGCATVVGTIVAVMMGMTWSFREVTLAAVGAYAVGVLALASVERRAQREP